MTDDYSAYINQDAATSSDALAQLSVLANDQASAEATVKELEAKLEKARESLREISERKIPELMDSLGMEEFKTSTGLKIKIKTSIRCSITKERQEVAFKWLRDNGHGGLIKRVVSVSFGKGEDESAEELFKELIVEYEGAEDKAAVHPSTLASFVKEQLADGEDFPMEIFGVHRQRTAVID